MFRRTVLAHRQGIHICAQTDHFPRIGALAFNHPHDASFPDASMHLDAERRERTRHNTGGSDFFETQLRIGMQIPSDRHELFVEHLNRCKRGSWLHSFSVRKLITSQSLPVLSCSEYVLLPLTRASSINVI